MGWETQTEVRTWGRVGREVLDTPAQAHPITASDLLTYLLGDLGHVQLIPELSGQPRKAPGAGCSLPTADSVPVALQRWLLPLGHSEYTAQFPGARCTRELLQEGGGKQQLLGAGCRGMAGRSPN